MTDDDEVLMTQRALDDDDQLMARLREIATTVDDPPPVLEVMARAALATRRVDGELAELMMDSAIAEGALVRAADDGVRLLSFETSSVSVELQLEEMDGRLTLRGLVSGASGAAVIEMAAESHTVPIDAGGWFVISGLPLGSVRVRLCALDGTAVTTSWVSV
jgi:hypothetical protein